MQNSRYIAFFLGMAMLLTGCQSQTNTEEQKTETPAKQVRSPKTNDRFPEYPFWIVLMLAGIAVSAGGLFALKKSGLKSQK